VTSPNPPIPSGSPTLDEALLHAGQSLKALMDIPVGHIRTDELTARSAKASALAQLSAAFALIDIAGAIRESTTARAAIARVGAVAEEFVAHGSSNSGNEREVGRQVLRALDETATGTET
jgi:hypothetical protein